MSYTPNENLTNISRGLVTGAEPFGSFGKRTAIGAVTLQILWPDGTMVLPASTGVQLSVVSTSASDTAAGTGIRTVDIHYLDANLAPQTETVTLNGTTPVLTVATNIRFVQCMHMITYGTGKVAAGTISATDGANVVSQIAIGEIRCTSSTRMVPAGKKLFVKSLYASTISPGSSETTVAFGATQFEGHDYSADSIFMPFAQTGFQDTGLTLQLDVPLVFTEGTAVGLLYTQTSTATVTGGWFGWLENA